MIVVVAAIIRRNGRILITKRFKDVHLGGLWEFPGGKVEPDEALTMALEREIVEELGVRIAVGQEFFRIEHHYPMKSVRLHFYQAAIVEGEPQALHVADLRWVLPSELPQFEFPEADRELIAQLCNPLDQL